MVRRSMRTEDFRFSYTMFNHDAIVASLMDYDFIFKNPDEEDFSKFFNIPAHNITFDPDTSDSCFIRRCCQVFPEYMEETRMKISGISIFAIIPCGNCSSNCRMFEHESDHTRNRRDTCYHDISRCCIWRFIGTSSRICCFRCQHLWKRQLQMV